MDKAIVFGIIVALVDANSTDMSSLNVKGLIIITTVFVALLLMAVISFFLWYKIRRQRVKKEA
ncbi:conserved hypothetical protein [Trichinella spiralis]|uniref:hypothetical protein n=1 Tax=Trichinella spiralis TaxID=6334 RepID=UPI0001EFDB60|nr:conserved hypothetical protein [Trichinella spiralis]